jgi:hypothetical protein
LCLEARSGYNTDMNEDEFRRLLQLGLGRAILYAQDHDVSKFRDLILDACLHCYAYDPQIEGTRADYMLELVDLTPEKEFYYNEVLKAVPGSGDDWDAMQRLRFAACLAFDGNERAKRVMYESYQPGPKMAEGIGIDFLQMDGIKGLLFAAEKIGALLMATKEKVDLGWLLSASTDELGEQETWDALRQAGAENPRIEAYRLAVEASRNGLDESISKNREIMNASYEELRPRLRESKRGFFSWIGSWGERASDEDIERAARGLLAAQDAKEQHAHLRIFSRRRFPLDPELLLSLVEVDQERVGFAALEALSQIAHPAVRKLAFRLVDTRARWRGQAIDLLAVNFEPGDHATVLGWFEAEEDEETRHSFGIDLRKFWERHPDEESAVPMLLALYERGPCSFCREGTVSRLIKRNALPEELRMECAYDANDDIRQLVKGSVSPSP